MGDQSTGVLYRSHYPNFPWYWFRWDIIHHEPTYKSFRPGLDIGQLGTKLLRAYSDYLHFAEKDKNMLHFGM